MCSHSRYCDTVILVTSHKCPSLSYCHVRYIVALAFSVLYRSDYHFLFAGFYFTGDGALRDIDGDYRITGRMDDVINVSGKRLGTAEIEDAMVTTDCLY